MTDPFLPVDLADVNAPATPADDAGRDVFLAQISHEVRSALQTILGQTERLQTTAAEPAARARLHALQSQAHLLARLVADLLDAGSGRGDVFRLRPVPCGLPAVIAEAVELHRADAHAKGLNFSLDLHPTLPSWARADPDRIRQVVANLVGNAVKFTARGVIRITVATSPPSNPAAPAAPAPPPAAGERLTISVSVADSGPGITAADQARLFQPFSRLHPESSPAGSGLGLTVAAALCRAMDGRVEVASDGQTGSCFTAHFNVEPCSPSDGAPTPVALARTPLQGVGRVYVIVADDNLLVRDLFRDWLEHAGAEVTAVADGLTALAMTRTRLPAVLVLDATMPGIDGIEVARQLRSDGLGPAQLRIVMVSGDPAVHGSARAPGAEIDAFLLKPCQPADLIAVVLGFRPTAASDAALVSPAGPALAARADRDDTLRPRLARLFGTQAAEHVRELDAALAAGDRAALQRLCHDFANSAFALGDTRLHAASSALEKASRQAGQPDPTTVASLRRELARHQPA